MSFNRFVNSIRVKADAARDAGDAGRATAIESSAAELIAAMDAFDAAMDSCKSLSREAPERARLFSAAAQRLDVAVARCQELMRLS